MIKYTTVWVSNNEECIVDVEFTFRKILIHVTDCIAFVWLLYGNILDLAHEILIYYSKWYCMFCTALYGNIMMI